MSLPAAPSTLRSRRPASFEMDIRDWVVVALIAGIEVSATVFLFCYPTGINFGTWAGITGTLTSAYHYIVLRDQKIPDADNGH